MVVLPDLEFAEEPLEAGEVLLVVAAEEVNQPAQGGPAVAFEECWAGQFAA
jgi:hypothetical protein